MCGSWARGTASPDSDIDLSIIVEDKNHFKHSNWLENFNFHKINDKIDYFTDEVYGRVWSRHVFLESKIEIEFSFADRSWADIKIIDEGTKKVVGDGYVILYDPHEILNNLVSQLMNSPK